MGRARARHVLGIDIGTTGARAVVVSEPDPDGRSELRAQADSGYALAAPRPGWAEQDPRDWWHGACAATRAALARGGLAAEDVVTVGLTGQMHSLVALDAAGEVLRPAILWCDQRTARQCTAIEEKLGGRARLVALTANRALTGFTAPKILWMRDEEPERFARMRRALVGKDYVRFRMTGEAATDVSEASGTLLFDVARRRWSDEVLAALEIDPALLPRACEGPEVTGQLTAAAAAELGLTPGIPVVGGGGDQAAGAVGAGVVAPGRTLAVLGTSGVVLSALGEPALDPEARLHMFCHAAPARWFHMGVTLAAGGSLRWLRDVLGAGADYPALLAEAARVPPGADGLRFAPYLAGERTPHDDPLVRGGFVGLDLSHGRGHLVRAVLEGVAMSLRDVLALLPASGGGREPVLLSGGGARGPLWVQIVADVLGRPVARLAADEGPALGAALLAGVGAGLFADVEAAARAHARLEPPVAPGPDCARYEDLYGEFVRLYPALRALARPEGPAES